jgi:hypothetical protein
MPARTTYTVVATVQGEYEDVPRELLCDIEYLSPNQDERTAMANHLRGAALRLAPEKGDSRSDVAIYAALDGARAGLMRGDFPNTASLLLGQLWALAEALDLEWYGVR